MADLLVVDMGTFNFAAVTVVQLLSRVQLFVTSWTAAQRLLCPWDLHARMLE